MSIHRRDVIKALAIMPMFSLAEPSHASLVPFATVQGRINILLHGLFFMQGNANNPTKWLLEIFAPDISDHHVFGGSWENVQELNQDVDWTTTGLHGKDQPTMSDKSPIPTDIETSIPQFSRDETKVGDLTGPYRRKLTFPWPQQIKSLRRGDFDTYFRPQIIANSEVGSNITKYCKGPNGSALLGTVPCLVYQYDFPALPGTNWAPTLNYHFYHEPCSDPYGMGHVNQALDEAAKLFKYHDKFKLILGDPNSEDPVLPGDAHDQPVPGVIPENDEICLNEDPYYSDWMSVCPHQRPEKHREQIQIIGTKFKRTYQLKHFLSISPANCPNFYVG
jgi:hypothetical protein